VREEATYFHDFISMRITFGVVDGRDGQLNKYLAGSHSKVIDYLILKD
jgi:hypothetical protein